MLSLVREHEIISVTTLARVFCYKAGNFGSYIFYQNVMLSWNQVYKMVGEMNTRLLFI